MKKYILILMMLAYGFCNSFAYWFPIHTEYHYYDDHLNHDCSSTATVYIRFVNGGGFDFEQVLRDVLDANFELLVCLDREDVENHYKETLNDYVLEQHICLTVCDFIPPIDAVISMAYDVCYWCNMRGIPVSCAFYRSAEMNETERYYDPLFYAPDEKYLVPWPIDSDGNRYWPCTCGSCSVMHECTCGNCPWED